MKKIKFLCLPLLLVIGLSGCLTSSITYQQITSENVDCKTNEIEISDEVVELNSEENWTAKCEGKVYSCSYHSSAGSDCNIVDE